MAKRKGLLAKSRPDAGRRNANPRGLFSGAGAEVKGPLTSQYNTNVGIAGQEQLANNPNEVNPFGSSTWSVGPDGRPVRTTTLNPWEQRKYQDQSYLDMGRNAIMGDSLLPRLQQNYGKALDYSGIEELPGQGDRFGYQREVANDVYNDFLDQNKATWGQEDQDFRQRMAEQGIPEGSVEYDRRFRQMMQGREQSKKSLQTQARLTGAGLAQNAFDQSLASRTQGINERNYLRQLPAQEMAGLLSMNTGVANPQYSQLTPTNIDPVDVTGTFLGNKTINTNRYLGELGASTQLGVAGINADASRDVANIRNEGDINAINAQQPSSSSVFGGILGSAAGGFAGGFGSSLGGSLFKSQPSTAQRRGLFGNIF